MENTFSVSNFQPHSFIHSISQPSTSNLWLHINNNNIIIIIMLRSLPKLSIIFSSTNNSRFLVNATQRFIFSFSTTTPASRVKFGVTARVPIRCMSTSPISSQTTAEDQVQRVKLLTSTDDNYGGVIVELDQLMDSTAFVSILKASILHWKQLGKKGVWIKLPIHLVSLAEALVKEGFWYHHAEPKYLMLVYWIPESPNTIPANATHRVGIGSFVMNEKHEEGFWYHHAEPKYLMLVYWIPESPNTIPANATHRVGIGSFVMNEKHEVLVVRENSGLFQGTGVWKFPTGVVDQGEDICIAAVREVKEETGVDSEFMEVLAFRQSHNSFFEKSDLFFLCMLRPLSSEIQVQRLEIEGAQWMPFVEYTAQPFIQKSDLLKYINDICLAKIDGRYSGYTPVSTLSNFSEHKFYLYLNAGELKESNS
ncbi:nudix hydrolase 2-like [Trifolium pratense]|uniref:nudix hydrolase 2-like n=1 Tax=Trifolium pratense TaxID=57577 RepID=UPI001E69227E|nr:nudix hydrolase 2-like [Trifolium pratense]